MLGCGSRGKDSVLPEGQYLLSSGDGVRMSFHQLLVRDGLRIRSTGDLQTQSSAAPTLIQKRPKETHKPWGPAWGLCAFILPPETHKSWGPAWGTLRIHPATWRSPVALSIADRQGASRSTCSPPTPQPSSGGGREGGACGDRNDDTQRAPVAKMLWCPIPTPTTPSSVAQTRWQF